MRFAAIAARATKKRSRAYALCAFFLRHIFCALELLRNSFIAHKKRRIQPERYAKCPPVFFGEYRQKQKKKIK
jgi:hypothetical protein